VFKLIPDKRFVKSYGKLPAQLRKQIDSKLLLLAENPNHPSLRAKRIQGAERLYELSVNMDAQLIWHYEGDSLIILLDVGHHDILKHF
jgi:mRNA-degrading endonuclease YafQ of YafQ-DinJ toxin-antitoxin module